MNKVEEKKFKYSRKLRQENLETLRILINNNFRNDNIIMYNNNSDIIPVWKAVLWKTQQESFSTLSITCARHYPGCWRLSKAPALRGALRVFKVVTFVFFKRQKSQILRTGEGYSLPVGKEMVTAELLLTDVLRLGLIRHLWQWDGNETSGLI